MVNGPSGSQLAGEGDVEVLVLDHVEQVARVLRLVQHDLHVGPLDREAAEQAGEDLGADALHEPDAQLAPVAADDGTDVGLGDAERGQHGLGVLEEHLAGGGEADRPGAAGAIEHRRAGGPLQRGDLLAHRRLGVAEGLGRLAEGAGLGHGDEGLQVADLEVHTST